MSVAQFKTDPKGQLSAGELNRLVGLQVRVRRRELGLSQDELGQLIGVSSQQIGKYEAGYNRLSLDVLVRICGALSAPLAYFVPDSRDVGRGSALLLRRREAEQLLETFSRIETEIGRDAVLSLADHFARQG